MASTIYDLKEVMDRLLAMEKEAVPGSGGATYWPYSQDKLPYWMNRLNPMTVDTTPSADIVVDRYSVSALLVIDHFDAGYEGTKFEDAYETYIPDVIHFFDDNPELTSAAYPDPLRYIDDKDPAYITGLPSGTRVVLNSGIGVRQVVLEFAIAVPLWRRQY